MYYCHFFVSLTENDSSCRYWRLSAEKKNVDRTSSINGRLSHFLLLNRSFSVTAVCEFIKVFLEIKENRNKFEIIFTPMLPRWELASLSFDVRCRTISVFIWFMSLLCRHVVLEKKRNLIELSILTKESNWISIVSEFSSSFLPSCSTWLQCSGKRRENLLFFL